jgi:peroxiredoxin
MVPYDELKEKGPRSPLLKRVLFWPAAALVLVGLVFLLQPVDRREAPSFELPLLSGDGSVSDSDLRGAPVVVNFFASWCAPCRDEARTLEKMWGRYEDEGIQFLGINVQDRVGPARDFVDRFGITFPIVRDADQDLARDLGVLGLPQTFFIDHEYNLAGAESGEKIGRSFGTTVFGAITEDELRQQIERLLEAWKD